MSDLKHDPRDIALSCTDEKIVIEAAKTINIDLRTIWRHQLIYGDTTQTKPGLIVRCATEAQAVMLRMVLSDYYVSQEKDDIERAKPFLERIKTIVDATYAEWEQTASEVGA